MAGPLQVCEFLLARLVYCNFHSWTLLLQACCCQLCFICAQFMMQIRPGHQVAASSLLRLQTLQARFGSKAEQLGQTQVRTSSHNLTKGNASVLQPGLQTLQWMIEHKL